MEKLEKTVYFVGSIWQIKSDEEFQVAKERLLEVIGKHRSVGLTQGEARQYFRLKGAVLSYYYEPEFCKNHGSKAIWVKESEL